MGNARLARFRSTGSGYNRGPSWVTSVVNAIGESSYWESTAIFVLWDDWGGWYDDAAPPQRDFRGLGIRVPCIIISPYARRGSGAGGGYVAHTQYEYGSILKFVEETFGLPPIGPPSRGFTDTRAASMLDDFDFTQPPRSFSPIGARYSESTFLHERPSYVPPETNDVYRAKGSPTMLVVAATLIGTSIEWYDFYIYGYAAALIFPRVFFPKADPFVGQLASYGIFWVGFLGRPLGGVIFGHFGDKVGRKAMLVVTLTIMGLATFLVGLLPTYNQIGVWAPVLLIALRLCQGVAVGGEWGGAVVMAAEHARTLQRAPRQLSSDGSAAGPHPCKCFFNAVTAPYSASGTRVRLLRALLAYAVPLQPRSRCNRSRLCASASWKRRPSSA